MSHNDKLNQKIKEAGELFYTGFSKKHAQDSEVNLKDFLFMLWQRKTFLITIILTSVTLMFIALNFVTPRYTATALVMIDSQSKAMDHLAVASEVEVLKSHTLARKVVYSLNLMNDPDFNKGRDRMDNIAHIFDRKTHSKIEKSDNDIDAVIKSFVKYTHIKPANNSSVLKVKFISIDPDKAALIANTIAVSYVDQRAEQSLQKSQKLSKWLDGQYDRLRKKVQSSRENIALYQLDNSGDNVVPSGLLNKEARLKNIKSQLTDAKLNLTKFEKRLQSHKIRKGTKSKAYATLKKQEKVLLGGISKLSASYGDKHPKMVLARKKLSSVRYNIRKEAKNTSGNSVAVSAKDIKAAKIQIYALERELQNIKRETSLKPTTMPEASPVDFQDLVEELEANKIILSTFLKSYKPTDNLSAVQQSGAYVLAHAMPPTYGAYPNKPLVLLWTILGSFIFGVALILLLRKLDYAYKTALQLENETGIPCFGVIGVTGERDENRPIADYILKKSAASIAEAVQSLHMIMALRKKKSEDPSTVVAITSSLPDEGKTTIASWLARIAAKSGERVIVIDCDLRRPSLHEAFGHKPYKTLDDYLTGRSNLDDLIFRDPVSKGHAIFSRSVPSNAMDLIGKARMKNLINALRKKYDLIILDSPACLAVPEAQLLSSYADQTLFVVSWDDTPREVVNASIKQFADLDDDALAFVLTNVDMERHLKYSCGDTVYYYNHYRQSYSD